MTRLVMTGSAPATQDKLNDFISLFLKWNRSINLSGARTEEQVHLHVLDCFHAVPHLRDFLLANDTPASVPRVLDVGSGGGLPSIVVAICLPHVQVTALEPVHKKSSFLRVAARELSLANFTALTERLDRHQASDYNAAMSRATFDLREWLLLGESHVRPGGIVLGFEAVRRSDLPEGTERHSYSLEDKARAIVVLQRPPADTPAQ